MKNKILNSPELHEDLKKETVWVFLGGPCQGSENWQSRFSQEFPDIGITICNPRRENMGDGPEYYSEQLEWERTHLEASDILAFWFAPKAFDVPGRDYGQTTRYELGEWITKAKESRKTMVLGIDQSIPGRRYFLEKASGCPWIHVVDSWDQFKEVVNREAAIKMISGTWWFTSDTHFGSERALKLSVRPFMDVSEMDWTMIRNWNSVVGPNDFVCHLGDFGNPEVLRWLNGRIRLCLGNYEESDPENLEELERREVLVFETGQVLNETPVVALRLSHRPSDAKIDKNIFSLFGHTHGRQTIKDWPGLDVGVDAHHFRPVSLDGILFWYAGITEHYDSENFL